MIDNPCLESGNMEPDVREKAKSFLKALESAIAVEAARQGVPRAFLPALMPCNVLCVLTQEQFHAVFTSENAGQLPRQVWTDSRTHTIP
jgi:hypothetical protein